MTTIGERLAKFNGIGPGFDFLRIALAILVVLDHSILTVMGNYHYISLHHLWIIFLNMVPMFFALSGFLICASAQRVKVKDFLLNRLLRIMPALVVDVLISAIIIGPLVTTVALTDYFLDSDFKHYFLNIIGYVHYYLPGVFKQNPHPGMVNGSLWTVPYEIGCYSIMSFLIIFGATKSRVRIFATVILFAILYCAVRVYFHHHVVPFASNVFLHEYLSNFEGISGRGLYFYFMAGVFIYVLREYIPFSIWLAVASVVLIVLAQIINPYMDSMQAQRLEDLSPILNFIPIGYLTIYIGLQDIPKLPLYSRGDYSYGTYLYSYPIQQFLVYEWPDRFSVIGDFILSMILVTIVAMMSWHCVEKPAMRIRKKYSFTARKGDDVLKLPTPEAS